MQVQMMNAWCKNLLHSHLWESCKCHCSLSLLLYQINIIFTIWGCLLLQYLGKRKKSIKFNRLRIEVLFIPIITPPMCMCEALNPSLTLELFFLWFRKSEIFSIFPSKSNSECNCSLIFNDKESGLYS